MLPALLSRPLPATDLHMWNVLLETAPQEFAHLYSLLSADEIARAERFYFERDRSRYIIGRGILRTLLGKYLGTEASEIQFNYGPHGKPTLEPVSMGQTLQFNLAHSNDRAIFIFGWDRPVGIDIEHVRPLQDADRFAEQFYSARETALINSLPGDDKWNAFYKLWTCKEAFLKAQGSGLTVPLNQVEVFLDGEDTARLIAIGGDTVQAADWKLWIFNPLPGYQAAIAIQGFEGQIQIQQKNRNYN